MENVALKKMLFSDESVINRDDEWYKRNAPEYLTKLNEVEKTFEDTLTCCEGLDVDDKRKILDDFLLNLYAAIYEVEEAQFLDGYKLGGKVTVETLISNKQEC